MAIAIVFISIPFFILAAVLSKGKGAGLIAGYNTMPDDKKARFDEKALCKFMGKVMYGVSFSILLLAVGDLLGSKSLVNIGSVLLFVIPVFAVTYSNTNNRFRWDVRGK